MTIWLKRRLALVFGGSAVLMTVGYGTAKLYAQSQTPKTPEEAAALFGRVLAATEPSLSTYNEDGSLRYWVISKESRTKLGSSGTGPLLTELQLQTKRPTFDASPAKQENGATVVEISPASRPKPLPVVIVPENGGYTVDLIATYAKNKNLGEGELQTDIFNRTGVVLPGMPDADSVYVQQRSCQTRLKELQLGILQYSQDYDEKFPLAKNWTEILSPYVPNKDSFNCPAVKGGKWGYALNSNLAGQPLAELKEVARTVSLYETSVPGPDVFGTGKDIENRHLVYVGDRPGSNVAFADGHVSFRYAEKRLDFSLNPPAPKPRNR
jgi:prepilin-type processing-associated H-X9-DG protein